MSMKLEPKYKRGMKLTIEIAEIHTHYTDEDHPYSVYRVKGINSLFLTDGAIEKILLQQNLEMISEDEWKVMFPKRMKRLLRESGLKQKELADQIGITEATMSRYCKGDRIPKGTTLVKIADVFGISVRELVAKGSKDER